MKAPLWYSGLRTWLKQQPKTVLASGAAALLVIGWLLYIPPLLAVRRVSAEQARLHAELERDRGVLDFAWRRKIQPLPGTRTMTRVLEQLHAHARKQGVEVLVLTPGSGSAAGPDAPTLLPVELQVEGEYKALGLFLGSLRQHPELGVVTLRRLRLAREERILPRLRAQMVLEVALGKGKES